MTSQRASRGFVLGDEMRKAIRERILARFNHQCSSCGSNENIHIDHIVPICRGGLDDESNKQVLCQTCNLSKGKGIDFSLFVKEEGGFVIMNRAAILDQPSDVFQAVAQYIDGLLYNMARRREYISAYDWAHTPVWVRTEGYLKISEGW